MMSPLGRTGAVACPAARKGRGRYRAWPLGAARWTIVALVLAGGSACSVLPQSEPQQVVTLPDPALAPTTPARPDPRTAGAAATAPSRDSAVIDMALRVATPYGNRMIAGNRILVRPVPGELSVYKGVRWSDAPPVMVRDRLVDALRADGRIRAVSNDSARVAATMELGGDLGRFQVEYAGERANVHIDYDAFLVDPRDSRMVAAKRFTLVEPVDGTQVPRVVQAFGRATDRLARDVVAWVTERGAAAAR